MVMLAVRRSRLLFTVSVVFMQVLLCSLLIILFSIQWVMPAISATDPAVPSGNALLSDKEVVNYLNDLKQRAFANTATGQFEAAITDWSELIDYFPEQAELWGNRGNVYAAQNKMEDAIADYNKAIELAPFSIDPLINRGVAWEGLQEWDKAIADYNRALKLEPDDAIAHNNRGNAQAGKGNWYGAIADYNQATILNPNFALAKANFALAMYEAGEHQQALTQMRRLVQRYPQFADARAALTVALWLDGKTGEAESNWFAAQGLDHRYSDLDWVKNVRRWPPSLVKGLGRFLSLK